MGFFGGATASPIMRQRTLSYDPSAPDMSGSPVADPTSSLGQQGGGPSRFQSFLGSLAQMGQSGQQPNPNRPKGILGGLGMLKGFGL